MITRFAPSPTGYLHLGHLVNALYVWGLRNALGGAVILRLEDHDRIRSRPKYEQALLQDLERLNLIPDQGLSGTGGPGSGPCRQQDRESIYLSALDQLQAKQLVYTCDCSRKQILARTGPQQGELRYDGHCRGRGLEPGPGTGLRLRLPDGSQHFEDGLQGPAVQNPQQQCGDLLIRDRDGNWTYQFAVVADDLDQEINLVVRGMDLHLSTGRQLALATCLGKSHPAIWVHHPLLVDAQGRKLSKRDFAADIHSELNQGVAPERLLAEAARRGGFDWPYRELHARDSGLLFAQ